MRKRNSLGILSLALLGIGIYQFRRHLVGRWLGLRPLGYKVKVKRGIKIPMPDGVRLATDHYSPVGERLQPTVLIRTPYGRSGSASVFGALPEFIANRFAERGYNVLVQDVRGRLDSEGEFMPFENESDDGRATLEWIEKQTWFNGVLGMWGPSYLGYVQWAVARNAPLYLKALMPITSGSRIPVMNFRDGGLGLDTILRWLLELDIIERMHEPGGLFKIRPMSISQFNRTIERAARHLPLEQVDQKLVGKTVPFFQSWLSRLSPFDSYWKKIDFGPDVRHVTASVYLMGGWYDIMLRETLSDYEELCRGGHTPYLTIGPWTHVGSGCMWESLRQGLAWFDANLKGDRSHLRQRPVRIFVMGEGKWREMDSWPPSAKPLLYFLNHRGVAGGADSGILTLEMPAADCAPESYIYDPRHPTPAVGGALMSLHAGPRDNRLLESRPDMLTFTTPPLVYDVEVIGPVKLILYVRSDLAYTDFFGRVCDVYPDGRSINICDGLLRLEPGKGEEQPDGSLCIEVDLWATAYLFRRGHAIRLQVSSGAHPRWCRNLGSGESIATGTSMAPAHQTIYHDSSHPSALSLPITNL